MQSKTMIGLQRSGNVILAIALLYYTSPAASSSPVQVITNTHRAITPPGNAIGKIHQPIFPTPIVLPAHHLPSQSVQAANIVHSLTAHAATAALINQLNTLPHLPLAATAVPISVSTHLPTLSAHPAVGITSGTANGHTFDNLHGRWSNPDWGFIMHGNSSAHNTLSIGPAAGGASGNAAGGSRLSSGSASGGNGIQGGGVGQGQGQGTSNGLGDGASHGASNGYGQGNTGSGTTTRIGTGTTTGSGSTSPGGSPQHGVTTGSTNGVDVGQGTGNPTNGKGLGDGAGHGNSNGLGMGNLGGTTTTPGGATGGGTNTHAGGANGNPGAGGVGQGLGNPGNPNGVGDGAGHGSSNGLGQGNQGGTTTTGGSTSGTSAPGTGNDTAQTNSSGTGGGNTSTNSGDPTIGTHTFGAGTSTGADGAPFSGRTTSPVLLQLSAGAGSSITQTDVSSQPQTGQELGGSLPSSGSTILSTDTVPKGPLADTAQATGQAVTAGIKLVATTYCSMYFLDGNNVDKGFIQGAPGTIFQVMEDNRTVQLLEGELLVVAGVPALSVTVRSASVFVPPHSAVLISAKRNGALEMVAIRTPGSAGAVAVRLAEGQTLQIHPGEEVLVANRALTDADYIYPSFIRSNENVIEQSGRFVKTASTRSSDWLEHHPMLLCNRFFQPRQNQQKPASSSSGLRPVSFTEGSERSQIAHTVRPGQLKDGTLVPTMTADASLSSAGEGIYRLSTGSVLLHTRTPLTVLTKHAAVCLRPGTVAIISAGAADTHVFNLHDLHSSSAQVVVGARRVTLMPGQDVTVTTGSDYRAALDGLRADGLPRRNTRMLPMGQRLAVISEFSPEQLLFTHPFAKALHMSDAAADRKLFKTLVKTAAALYVVTANNSGPYSNLTSEDSVER